MMLAASTSLVYEGITVVEPLGHAAHQGFLAAIPQSLRVLMGIVGGLVFIVSTKKLLDEHEEIKIAGLDGTNERSGV